MADEKNASIGESNGSNEKIPTILAIKFITKKINFNVLNILRIFFNVSLLMLLMIDRINMYILLRLYFVNFTCLRLYV